MRRKRETETKGKNPVLSVCGAVLAAYVLTAVIFSVYAALLTYTSLGEGNMQLVVTVGAGAAVLFGGFLAARAVKKRGILWGTLTGVLYGSVMIVISSSVNPDFGFGTRTAVLMCVAVCGGGLGGVLGVK